ncbi:MAG TPA: zf-TFIIB domain-containing protein [Bacteroidales bacterium]|nr:zf-TFIIB domain-containing protein [Bacteroidales bacterium]HPS26843.1 zf-TFIIB domain-containing protein [Bacteroidales bacterium]
MICPVCKKPMLVLELQQIEIDYCQECGGIWLDEGELELLLGAAQEKDDLMSSFSADLKNSEKKRRCPACSKKMNKVLVGKNNRVLLDKCRKNHGFWFDSGELNEVLELASGDKYNKILQLLNEMFAHKLKSNIN